MTSPRPLVPLFAPSLPGRPGPSSPEVPGRSQVLECHLCLLEWPQGASSRPRPAPLGAGGVPGLQAEAESCRGCSPQSPRRGWPPSPPSPLHRSIPAPIDGRFPAGEGRCCPAGQEKWLFAEPGAGSGIDLWCLVRDQLGPVIKPCPERSGSLGWEGSREMPGWARDAREPPSLHIHTPFPASVSRIRAGLEAVPA